MDTTIQPAIRLLVVLAVLTPTARATAREWKDSTGKFSVEAEFVDLVEETVRLKKTDGKVVALPLTRLQRRDIAFIRRHVATLEKVKRAVVEHGDDPTWLLSALLDGGYRAEVGKLPRIDNPIAKRVIARVMKELRNGKYKPNVKTLPKLVAAIRDNNLSESLTIFPDATVQRELVQNVVQKMPATTTMEFYEERRTAGSNRRGKISTSESATASPLQWYKWDWLELGVADELVRVVRITGKS